MRRRSPPARRGVEERRLEAGELARRIADDLAEKQAEEVVVLDISELTDIAEFFVIASGSSRRQLGALEQAVLDVPDVARPKREGSAEGGWRLFDFGGVVVHLFDPELREFYDLERLWSESRQLLRIQ